MSHTRHPAKRSRKALTLLEVVVVASIIVLLASAVLLSLVRVRATAKGFVCKNNLKTVGFDFAQFADSTLTAVKAAGSGGADSASKIFRKSSITLTSSGKGRRRAKSNTGRQTLL